MKMRKPQRYRKPEDDGTGLGLGTGGTPVDSSAPDAGAVAASAVAAAPAPEAPKSMAEAMWGGEQAAAAPAGAPAIAVQPRDELGRFTFKNDQGQAVDKDGVPAPDQAAALAAQAAASAPATPEDPTKMPEGLGAKAQERFQTLANSNKELTAKVERFEAEIMPAVQAMQQTWTENQVQPEQFQEAMAIIGMMNRGDFAGALQALQPQLQLLAAHAGQSVTVDPLAGHADLQNLVQTLQMTPEAAAEVARARAMQGAQQQHQQRQQQQADQQRQQQEQAQQHQQARAKAQADVNTFCVGKSKTDLDYSAIEAQLLPVLPQLLADVPPARWAAMVEQQYNLIKGAVGAARRTPAAPAVQPMRPGGLGGGAPQPKTMFDAMWNTGASA